MSSALRRICPGWWRGHGMEVVAGAVDFEKRKPWRPVPEVRPASVPLFPDGSVLQRTLVKLPEFLSPHGEVMVGIHSSEEGWTSSTSLGADIVSQRTDVDLNHVASAYAPLSLRGKTARRLMGYQHRPKRRRDTVALWRFLTAPADDGLAIEHGKRIARLLRRLGKHPDAAEMDYFVNVWIDAHPDLYERVAPQRMHLPSCAKPVTMHIFAGPGGTMATSTTGGGVYEARTIETVQQVRIIG